jgi:hypothetical protein
VSPKLGVGASAGFSAFLAMSAVAFAEENKLYVIPSEGVGNAVYYSTCPTNDSWQECLSHELGCDLTKGVPNIYLRIIEAAHGSNFDLPALIGSIVASPIQSKELEFGLNKGAVTARVSIDEFALSRNEMDGGWILSLYTFEPRTLFEVLTLRTAEGATASVGDASFSIMPTAYEPGALLNLKQVCPS